MGSSSAASHSIPILNTLSNTIIPVQLQEDNYHAWKSLIVPVLTEYEVLGFVDGSYKTPSQLSDDGNMVNPEYAEWLSEDQRLLVFLHSTMSESVLTYVVAGLSTSRDLWVYLEERFGADASRTNPACQICIKFSLYLACPVLLIVLLCISFLIPDPKVPKYAVSSISIKGINLTSSIYSDDLIVSPEIDIAINATNPNGAPGTYYSEKGFSVSVFYSDILLCSSNNSVPTFYQQPSENVTIIETLLTGSRIKLTPIIRDSLLDRQSKGMTTTLVIYMWIFYGVKNELHPIVSMSTHKVRCKVTVDKLAVDSQIVSNVCRTVKKSTGSVSLLDQGLQLLSEN